MLAEREKALVAFKKTHSLISRIIEMIEEDKYCIDIMQQNLAAIGLLRSAHMKIMESHLNNCVKKAMQADDKKRQDEMIHEILTVTNLFNK
jgi:DNA-binding FrmR family transcriptional regulator